MHKYGIALAVALGLGALTPAWGFGGRLFHRYGCCGGGMVVGRSYCCPSYYPAPFAGYSVSVTYGCAGGAPTGYGCYGSTPAFGNVYSGGVPASYPVGYSSAPSFRSVPSATEVPVSEPVPVDATPVAGPEERRVLPSTPVPADSRFQPSTLPRTPREIKGAEPVPPPREVKRSEAEPVDAPPPPPRKEESREERRSPPSGEKLGPPDEEAEGPAPATIVVTLPAEAKLIVNRTPTRLTSGTRTFVSPPLKPGKEFYYTLQAEMERDGQKYSANKRVAVHSGDRLEIAFDFPQTPAPER